MTSASSASYPSSHADCRNFVNTFYIPRLQLKYTVDDICQAFSYYAVVDRVDIVPLKDERAASKYTSAFVYVSCWNYAPNMDNTYMDSMVFALYIQAPFRFEPFPDSTDFWILCPNHNPIPKTSLNIHQLAESNRALWDRVNDLEGIIAAIDLQTASHPQSRALASSVEDAVASTSDRIREEDVAHIVPTTHVLGVDVRGDAGKISP